MLLKQKTYSNGKKIQKKNVMTRESFNNLYLVYFEFITFLRAKTVFSFKNVFKMIQKCKKT